MAPRLTLNRIRFNRAANRYVGTDGKFISRRAVINEIDKEQRRLDRKFQLRYSKYLRGLLTLQQFEREFIKEMKRSLIRANLTGHGGIETFNSRYVKIKTRMLEGQIRTQFDIFFNLVTKIDNQELSEKQIRDRLNRMSRKVRVEFNQADLDSRILNNGHNVGRRKLDPDANHCPDCPALATDGFVPIEQIIAIGTACRCGGYCRCRIETKFDRTVAAKARTLTFNESIISRKQAVNVMLEAIAA